MKNIFLVAVVLFAGHQAVAGYGECKTNEVMSCRADYNMKDKSLMEGPSDQKAVTDLQMEPFDPADCEAAVVLFTAVGKVVVNYNQTLGYISAWVNYDGKETSYLQSSPVRSQEKTVITIPSSDPTCAVASATIECQRISK